MTEVPKEREESSVRCQGCDAPQGPMCRECKEVFILPIAMEAGAEVPASVVLRVGKHEVLKMGAFFENPKPFTVGKEEISDIVRSWLNA